MFFKNLPKHIQDGIKQLTVDKEFQKRFAHDPRLDEIDEMKVNMSDELKSLQSLISAPIVINGIQFKNITPIMWSFLWCIESPLLNASDKKINEIDIDVFFYILENGIGDADPVRIVTEALNFTSKNLQITCNDRTVNYYGTCTNGIQTS